jgi:Fe2+ transport system protein FeoA
MEHIKSEKLIQSMDILRNFIESNTEIKNKYKQYITNYKDKSSTFEKTLKDLKVGEKAKVLEVRGNEAIKRRLMVMGITSGIDVELLRKAPLGDPIEVLIRGYNVAIRKTEAENIILEK